jgi:Protein of unknown function (DUF1592)/Protein of unknown function (DUF1588)/Protein of unknown function (DUF1595)/Protein of unknown function (DUF1585)/Protein of unknown function (DUF1587)
MAGCYGFSADEAPSPANGMGASGGPVPVGPAAVQPAATPVSRLGSTQLALTIADLFAPVQVPPLSFPADSRVEGFDTNAAAQAPSAALIEALQNAAIAASEAAMTTPEAFLGCLPKSRSEEDSCAAAFITRFGERAYRRPIEAEERQTLIDLYSGFRTDGETFSGAMTLVTQTVLQAPAFVYRLEAGAGPSASPGRTKLSSYEMASRLSFLLWNTKPDDTLLAAAKRGELTDETSLETQAKRLLQDKRARPALQRFHAQWLRFDRMDNLKKDASRYPVYNAQVGAAMVESVNAFVERTFFENGSLQTFFTDDHAYVNDTLAPIFGVPSPGAKLSWVAVDKTQRSGILTQPGILAGLAHELDGSPILRGVFTLDAFMCTPPPPPPANIPSLEAPNPAKPKTNRERLELQHEVGACAGCHKAIDGVGFAFEHYDAIGQWRTKDSGFEVNAKGVFPDASQGTFEGAAELGQKLAVSASVQNCIAKQWYRYALGVDSRGVDQVQIDDIVTKFRSSNLNLQSLVLALIKSEAFRSRIAGVQQ